MNRMLDAAEALLEQGGPDALTVEAVVRQSNSSTGSFYARFGDRHGLLIAMQDRFLGRLGESLATAFAGAAGQGDLEAVVDRIVQEFFRVFRQHRSAFHAYMILHRSDPTMRSRGAQASRETAAAMRELLARHSDRIRHPDPDVAADFVYRTLFALATQTVMFDDREVTARRFDERTRTREATRAVLAYLCA